MPSQHRTLWRNAEEAKPATKNWLKQGLGWSAVAVLASLAACGGGSGNVMNPTPTNIQTATPVPYTVLHSFNGSNGQNPYAELVGDDAGNWYGTTVNGGTNSKGTIFKISATGVQTVLHSFDGGDGAYPVAGLVGDGVGNWYGTTQNGGINDSGTVFKIDRAGSQFVLHSFSGGDGGIPYARLLGDGAGNWYGTTERGGTYNMGTIFKISAAGVQTVLHSFAGGSDGKTPSAGLVNDGAGNLYGTALQGGANGYGTVFKIDTAGVQSVLHSFNIADGAYPQAELVGDGAGNWYGTTGAGGGALGYGAVFKISSAGVYSVLHSFSNGDGSFLYGRLVGDGAGNWYGTTMQGGANNLGTVFKISATGVLSVLHNFAGGSDGATPSAGLVRDGAGYLYGTTLYGGINDMGTVFRLSMD